MHKKFILQNKGKEISVSGEPSAFFGYKLGDDDGIYVEWKWENNHFELKNDRYGFYPLFYYVTKDGFGVSPSIVDLLQNCSSTDLDDPRFRFLSDLALTSTTIRLSKQFMHYPLDQNLSGRKVDSLLNRIIFKFEAAKLYYPDIAPQKCTVNYSNRQLKNFLPMKKKKSHYLSQAEEIQDIYYLRS